MRHLAAALALLAAASCGPPSRPANRILLVTIDTLRADRLGYAGHDIATPNLDRLAEEGVVFANAVTAAPITLPSHASIMSGLYPTRHGTRHNGMFRVADDVETLAETLAADGFETAAFIGAFVLDRRFGLEQGFDHYDDELPEQNETHAIYYAERRAEDVIARALSWMEAPGRDRFFVWVHLFDPHAPHNAPSPFAEQYGARDYDAEIAYTDHALGPLFAKMRSLDDAAVVVTADHGEGRGDHGESTHTLFVYDSTMKVPLIVNAPGISSGRTVHQQVRTVDIAPTLLELASVSSARDIDGTSLLAHAAGETTGDLPAYGETFGTRYQFNWAELRFLRDGAFKVIDAPRPELYDLKSDPGETENLWSDRPPAEGKRLMRELRALAANDRPGATIEVDAETKRRLESLGYVMAATGDAADTIRPDPKDRVEIFEKLQSLLSPGLTADEQIAGYRDVLAIEPANTLARSRLANLLAQENRLEAAVVEYQELLRVSEIDSGSWENLASALLLLNRTEEALAITERAVAEAPWYRELQVLRGEALEKAGRLEEALAAYERAIELRPELGENYWRHGSVALAMGDAATAERDFRESIRRDPAFDEGRMALVRLLARSGRGDEAVATARESESGDAAMNVALAEAQLASGRFADAQRLLEDALAVDPDNSAALALLGPVYGRAGELDRGAAALERAKELGRATPDVRRNLALVYLRQRRTEAALRELEVAARQAPGNASVWLTLGNAHLAARDGRRAVDAFERALELRPGWPDATFNLGLAYQQAGEGANAAAAFREFLSGSGAGDEAKRRDAERRLNALAR